MRFEDLMLGIISVQRDVLVTNDILYVLVFQLANNVTGSIYINITANVTGPVHSTNPEMKKLLFENRHAFMLATVCYEMGYSFQEKRFSKAMPAVTLLQ